MWEYTLYYINKLLFIKKKKGKVSAPKQTQNSADDLICHPYPIDVIWAHTHIHVN